VGFPRPDARAHETPILRINIIELLTASTIASEEQAERVSGRVEEHSDVILRLE
jgi:hypothetical protein